MKRTICRVLGMIAVCLGLAACSQAGTEAGVYENQAMNFQTVLPAWEEGQTSMETSEYEAYGEMVQGAKLIYHGEAADCNPVTFEEMSLNVWEAMQKEGGPLGTELGRQDGRVVVLNMIQSNPYEEGSRDFEAMKDLPEAVEAIRENFSFLQ